MYHCVNSDEETKDAMMKSSRSSRHYMVSKKGSSSLRHQYPNTRGEYNLYSYSSFGIWHSSLDAATWFHPA